MTVSRREALVLAGAGAIGGAAAPVDATGWGKVAAQYPLPSGVVQLEHGYWGSMAKPVEAAWAERARRLNRDTALYARRAMVRDLEAVVARAAAEMGGRPEDVALVRNASEGLSALIGQVKGVGAGDQIVRADVDVSGGCSGEPPRRLGPDPCFWVIHKLIRGRPWAEVAKDFFHSVSKYRTVYKSKRFCFVECPNIICTIYNVFRDGFRSYRCPGRRDAELPTKKKRNPTIRADIYGSDERSKPAWGSIRKGNTRKFVKRLLGGNSHLSVSLKSEREKSGDAQCPALRFERFNQCCYDEISRMPDFVRNV